MAKKQKTEEKEKPKIPVSFKELLNGHLLEEVYNPQKDEVEFAYWNGEKVQYFPFYDKGLDNRYIPINSDIITKGVIKLPSKAMEYENDTVLFNQIKAFIHKYVDVSEHFENLSACYVLSTWVYDMFDSTAYLRVLGDTGCGKSRFLQVVGFICYKPMIASGATTPSPIFHIIDRWSGTLILDEADFKATDMWADIIKILNNGFQKGFPVLRSDMRKEKNFQEVAYNVFCPKLLATRRRFNDKALESRCLTEVMTETDRNIPKNLPKEFYNEAQEIRNKLLMWRFHHYNNVAVDGVYEVGAVENRLNQIIQPLFAVIKDAELRRQLESFIRAYNEEIVEDRASSEDGVIVQAVIELKEAQNDEIPVKDVRKKVNEILDNGILGGGISFQKLGARLKGLGFQSRHTRNGNLLVCDECLISKLRKRYTVKNESDSSGMCEEVKSVNNRLDNIKIINRGGEESTHISKKSSPSSHVHQFLSTAKEIKDDNGEFDYDVHCAKLGWDKNEYEEVVNALKGRGEIYEPDLNKLKLVK